jgi:uncharacterized protein YcfL
MKTCFAIVLTGIVLAGCVKPPIMARQDPYLPAQVQLTDEDLRQHIAVDAPKVTRDADGRLVFVTLPIRAATNLQLYIDYRVTFLDSNGQVLSQSGWMNKTLAPNVFDYIQVNSMSPRAHDFQIQLRYAK